ncbi:MAG: M48 family metallopeptidase [Deltaproteobacteria bacterium]|nr:M48 family metallopeptidase [Deltaproteobacteria bacterium]
MSETLEVGGLTFEVRRSLRRKTLGLTVDRGRELVIHAPEETTDHELTRWTRSKLLWVHRRLARKEALALKVRAPEFVSGENFSYLGRNYRLKSVREPAEPLRFDGTYFWLAVDARGEAEAHFRRWYIRTGRVWLSQRTAALARKTGTEALRIEVRELGFRWGSCGKNGVLFFNWRLLQLPVRLIDYVIVHELVHIQEPHHSPEFWQAIDRALPVWRTLKDALRNDATRFLVFGMDSLRSL